MSDRERDALLKSLREEIGDDFRPQRPLSAAWRRALFLLPLWLTAALLVVTLLGYRMDYLILGEGVAWTLVSVQTVAAFLILWQGLRLVIPGSFSALGNVLGALFLSLALHLFLAAMTFQISPMITPEGLGWELGWACFKANLYLGLLPFLMALFLASRGLPQRPLLVGSVCGLAAGLAGEAVWRMHCPLSDLAHILPAHTGAVLILATLGLLAGLFWRRKWAMES